MDALDRIILSMLSRDGRTPYSRIAEEAGVATTTVHQRAKRLTEKGVIIGTRVDVGWGAIGLPVAATVFVEAPENTPLAEIASQIGSIPHVQSCYAVTGEFDLLLVIRAASSEHLGELLEEIREYAPGRTRTVLILSTHFEDRIPLD